jgi:AhpC/TSA antioxidant enzyme
VLMLLVDCAQVSMGPPERGLEFAELTEFPPELLLADPENVTYDKLELKNTGPIATFFDPRVGGCTCMMSQPEPNVRRNAASHSRQVE